MGNLVVQPIWEPGIRHFEANAVLTGGPDCPDNLPLQDLANRTAWLKAAVDAVTANYNGKQDADATLTALAALVVAADKMIYSTGPDAFATAALTAYARTILACVDAATARTALGAASAASPALTGIPTAPTAAPGTNTTQLSTTAFVQAAVAALLATTLGNDVNFSTTVTNALATKALAASPTLTGAIALNGAVRGSVTPMATLTIDCSTGNFFTKTIAANSSFLFSNVPAGCSYSLTLDLTHSGGTVSFPAAVNFSNDVTSLPLNTGKSHLFMLVTDNGGVRWRGAVLPNYTT